MRRKQKRSKKIINIDRDRHTEEKINKNLELGDKSVGIKELKQQYTPETDERSHWDDAIKLCSKEQQAEQTATFLDNKQWDDFLHEGA